MGLMEKALQYKKEMNSRGKETLIDKIQGPAETEMLGEPIIPDDAEAETMPSGGDEAGTSMDALLEGDTPVSSGVDDDLFKLPEESGGGVDNAVSAADGQEELAEEISLSSEDLTPVDLPESPRPRPISAEEEPDPLGPEDEPAAFSREVPARSDDKPQADKKAPAPANEPGERISGRIEQTGRQNKRFHDFMVLYEIGKEIVKAETRKELYDVILFSIMGQIGASSSSILIPDPADGNRWIIADFRGITVKNMELRFDTSARILGTVLKKREIVDLEEYKDKPEHRDEYFEFVSIDVRLLSPLSYDGRVFGALGLGEKITIGDYSDAEKDFILSISEVAAVALSKINAIEALKNDLGRKEEYLVSRQRIDDFRERVTATTDINVLKESVRKELEGAGVQSFAVFLRSERNDALVPEICEEEDSLRIMESGMVIPGDGAAGAYLQGIKDGAMVENFASLDAIRSVFSEDQLREMQLLWIYPFSLGMRLAAFLAIFSISEPERAELLHRRLREMAALLLPYMVSIKEGHSEATRYFDAIGPVMRKLSHSFANAKNLNIPFTLVLFSIKNLKRYYNLYGHEETARLIDRCESVITSRLSDSDFAVRLDRNRILLALPGKNKKFGVPLANTVRNEIVQSFTRKEMQLMLVYLCAEFPEDGDDLYALLDSIE
jgi:GGDEF domain-containing protein